MRAMTKSEDTFNFFKKKEPIFNKSEKIAKYITILSMSPFQIVAYMTLTAIIVPISKFPALNIFVNIISGIFYILIPLIPLIVLGRKSRLVGAQFPREERYIVFLTIIPGYLTVIFIYSFIRTYFNLLLSPLINFTISYVIVLIIDFIITCIFKFKTSMHISGAMCGITAMGFYLGPLILLLYLFVPIIAWARWKIKGHTVKQLISGGINGFFTTLISQFILLLLL